MKQVVVNGGETYGGLLTPYWTVEYLKRKGIKAYVYNYEVGLDDTFEYTLVEDVSTLNNPEENYAVEYLTKNVGVFLSEKEWEDLELNNYYMIDTYDLFKNREDIDLVEITKEINNEDLIKIIEIPDDVKYEIHQSECGFNEWIQEVSRVWY